MLAHYKDELNSYTDYCADYLYPILENDKQLSETEKEDYKTYKNLLDTISVMLEENNEISNDDLCKNAYINLNYFGSK